MRLIEQVRIVRFRSVRDAELSNVGDFSVLAGLNNAGKSNFLRALNVFFNGEVEPGAAVDVLRDTYRLKGKKISFRVEVTFSLPPSFRFRQDLAQVQNLLTARPVIAKEWERGATRPTYYLTGSSLPADEDARTKIDQFLSLITFRYVPNRVLPLDLIRREHASLRGVLIRRVAKSGADRDKLFKELTAASEKLVASVALRMKAASEDIESIRLATPLTLADMVFAFGYRVSEEGSEFEDSVQGSGLQSLLLVQTLALIDRDYSNQFGWKQAAIWAMEEPESSLHSSLEAETASLLRELATEPNGRLQILATTHSSLMIQYSDGGWLVQKSSTVGDRKASRLIAHSPEQLLDEAARAGVSQWIDPILHFPLQPLVLVEGKWDEIFIRNALRLLGLSHTCRVTYLELLSEGSTGGNEEMRKYLKAHARQIRSRAANAPVVAVLDWEDASKKTAFEALVPAQAPYRVLPWPASDCNPNLGTSFPGIERFFSDRIIELAIARGAAIGRQSSGEYVTNLKDHAATKKLLAEIVDRELILDDIRHARRFLEAVVAATKP